MLGVRTKYLIILSTYLNLAEDREPTSHQVVSDFRLLVRYYHVLYS
jgi:hypothetical protein